MEGLILQGFDSLELYRPNLLSGGKDWTLSSAEATISLLQPFKKKVEFSI